MLQIFSSVISYGASQQIQRDGHSFFRSFSISLFLIYVICSSIFFMDISSYFTWLKNLPIERIAIFTIFIIIALIFVKAALGHVLGLITKERVAASDCFFQYASNLYTSGLVMLVICLLVHYSGFSNAYLFFLGITLTGLLFTLRIIKTVAFGYLRYGFSIFHLVLYLCAVEIIPLAIFVKIIVRS